MSVEKVDMKSQEPSKQDGYQTVDLEMKLLEVGDLKYNVDMRQNGQSRFFRISETSFNSRGRIVVPMCVEEEFRKKLLEVMRFASSYEPANISEKKSPRDRTVFAFSTSYFTPGGRRYYFDVVDAQSTLTLRISYVFVGRRDCIRILVQAIPKLGGIIEQFHQNYPSLSQSDDYPANNFRRRGNSSRPPSGQRTRGFSFGRGRRFNRGFRNSSGQQYNGKPSPREQGEAKRPGALQVLTEPAPLTITCGAKTYVFQIAEGAHTFLRINEAIKDNYKSSLHIPIELITEFQSALVEMNKKYSAVKPAQPTEKA